LLLKARINGKCDERGENKGKRERGMEGESAIRAKREDDALFRQVRPMWYSASSGEGRDETV
jgi:hypothetical protein